MKTLFCSLAIIAGACLIQGCASPSHKHTLTSSDDARAYLEVLRSDFNGTKIRVLNEAMKLTVPEANKFWPIYRNYEQELAGVGDRKLALIVEFLGRHKAGTLDDQNSKDLGDRFLQNAQERLDLWKKYYAQICEAVSPIRGAQFMQIENQMAIFVDLSIASEMPAVGQPPKVK